MMQTDKGSENGGRVPWPSTTTSTAVWIAQIQPQTSPVDGDDDGAAAAAAQLQHRSSTETWPGHDVEDRSTISTCASWIQ